MRSRDTVVIHRHSFLSGLSHSPAMPVPPSSPPRQKAARRGEVQASRCPERELRSHSLPHLQLTNLYPPSSLDDGTGTRRRLICVVSDRFCLLSLPSLTTSRTQCYVSLQVPARLQLPEHRARYEVTVSSLRVGQRSFLRPPCREFNFAYACRYIVHEQLPPSPSL